MASFVQDGDTLDYTPVAAVTAGDVVVVGDIIGVAARSIAAGKLGAITVSGVHSIAKDASVFAIGDKVFWNPTGDPVGGTAGTGAMTLTATGSTLFAGICVAVAVTGAAEVKVALASGRRNMRLARSTVAATGSTNADAALTAAEGFVTVTAADATKGVKLPPMVAGGSVTIKNNAAAVLKVYPGTGVQLNGGTATTGSLNMAANTIATFYADSATVIFSHPLLPS